MFQKIDNCSDVDANVIESWLEADSDGYYGTITDDKIIVSRALRTLKKFNNELLAVTSHKEAVSQLE